MDSSGPLLLLGGRSLFRPGDRAILTDPSSPGTEKVVTITSVLINGRTRVLYEIALFDEGRRHEITVDEFEVRELNA